jgi:hypothetical protein
MAKAVFHDGIKWLSFSIKSREALTKGSGMSYVNRSNLQ